MTVASPREAGLDAHNEIDVPDDAVRTRVRRWGFAGRCRAGDRLRFRDGVRHVVRSAASQSSTEPHREHRCVAVAERRRPASNTLVLVRHPDHQRARARKVTGLPRISARRAKVELRARAGVGEEPERSSGCSSRPSTSGTFSSASRAWPSRGTPRSWPDGSSKPCAPAAETISAGGRRSC